MGTMMNRDAYQKLVDENIEWLMKQPRSLERDHIVEIVKCSVGMIYDPPRKRNFCERLTPKKER